MTNVYSRLTALRKANWREFLSTFCPQTSPPHFPIIGEPIHRSVDKSCGRHARNRFAAVSQFESFLKLYSSRFSSFTHAQLTHPSAFVKACGAPAELARRAERWRKWRRAPRSKRPRGPAMTSSSRLAVSDEPKAAIDDAASHPKMRPLGRLTGPSAPVPSPTVLSRPEGRLRRGLPLSGEPDPAIHRSCAARLRTGLPRSDGLAAAVPV